MAAKGPVNVKAIEPTPVGPGRHSPLHSPLPYLFGGLAAMLALIAFSLLILACSYRKKSSVTGGGERDLEAGDVGHNNGDGKKQQSAAFEENILVIMAGQANPTFLASPVSRIKSFSYNKESEKEEIGGGLGLGLGV